MANVLDDYLTEGQLLAELRISIATLKRWRKDGDAPPKTKIGRRVYYDRAAVKDWIRKSNGAVAAAAQ